MDGNTEPGPQRPACHSGSACAKRPVNVLGPFSWGKPLREALSPFEQVLANELRPHGQEVGESEFESSSSDSIFSVLGMFLMEFFFFFPPFAVGKRPERCQRWGPGPEALTLFGGPLWS